MYIEYIMTGGRKSISMSQIKIIKIKLHDKRGEKGGGNIERVTKIGHNDNSFT